MNRAIRNSLLFSLLLGLSHIVAGQTTSDYRPKEDVVYLENGWIIKGTITSHTAENITIESREGNTFVFPTADVREVAQEAKPRRYRDVWFRSKGYYSATNIGVLIGNEWGYTSGTFLFQQSHGYRFNDYLSTGLGAGISTFSSGVYIPLFAEIRGDLAKTQVRPFYHAQAGYAFATRPNDEWTDWNGGSVTTTNPGGYMWALSTGIRIGTRSRVSWVFETGYYVSRSETTTVWETSRSTNTQRITARRVFVSTGIMF
ncbi:hypothetical protein [Pontibacter sp. G13]|uniref:hypothetical protein n=1 Tax=Pontibacter sp. G13 TaxID=3074898 RepID=UPI00288912B0|nr:hypothetical protein [Pontibacter sp. G13]WNJ16960.1 hypothetical protein RJD25_19070 [Pontibacter sp. G13]